MLAKKPYNVLPLVSVALGLLGLTLYLAMAIFARDGKGLVAAHHPLAVAAVAAMAGSLAFSLYAALTMTDGKGYAQSFPGSNSACLGHGLAGLGIVLTVLTTQPAMAGKLASLWRLLGLVSAPCLMTAGLLRREGKKPSFLTHLVPAVFLMVHIVSNYRAWSSEPQVMNYLFPLFAIVCMLLYVFYHSAFDVGLEWRQKLTFFAYASVCLGLAAIPGSGYPWLYLGCSLWALLDQPALRPRRRKTEPQQEETP